MAMHLRHALVLHEGHRGWGVLLVCLIAASTIHYVQQQNLEVSLKCTRQEVDGHTKRQ